jgi:hypothetical protein
VLAFAWSRLGSVPVQPVQLSSWIACVTSIPVTWMSAIWFNVGTASGLSRPKALLATADPASLKAVTRQANCFATSVLAGL